jgi:hypothetical protein
MRKVKIVVYGAVPEHGMPEPGTLHEGVRSVNRIFQADGGRGMMCGAPP